MSEFVREQFAEHQRVVAEAANHAELLEQIAARIVECFESGGRLYVLGNGGSAADAQHIAAELTGRFLRERRALPAIALTTDTSALTAIGNDYGFERVFERQIEALVTNRDVVLALSVSGRSPNVLRGLEAARKIGAGRVGFTGRGGSAMRELCDLCFVVDHERSDRVQETHLLAYHLVCGLIERRFAG